MGGLDNVGLVVKGEILGLNSDGLVFCGTRWAGQNLDRIVILHETPESKGLLMVWQDHHAPVVTCF